MHSAEKFDVGTLNWVKGEIDETLKQARLALEAYAENSDDINQLQFCIAYLHQVGGTLQMVELQGAAKFASEIEQVAQALQEGKIADRDAAFEVLMRAILQLPDYLESLQSGGSDNSAVLGPLLNELRIARGEAGLDATELFNPNMSILPPVAVTGSGDAQLAARKLRPYYQAALLKLLRGQDSAAQLKILSSAIEKLYHLLAQEEACRWAWILRGLLEGLLDGGIPVGAQQKQLLGKCDQILRQIAEHGASALSAQQMVELNHGMLFQVASSASHGERVRGLREAFRLDSHAQDSALSGQQLLGGFNSELKRTVSADVLVELGRIKDAFDIFVRSDRQDSSGLTSMADNLTTIADTLILLRQENNAQMLRDQAAVLRQLGDGGLTGDDATLMGVAGAIIYVESALADWGNDAPVELADDATGQVSGSEAGEQVEAEHRRVIRQVMKEARDGVIKIRESINQYLESSHDRAQLATVPVQLHEIVGSLTMLSYTRVAQVLRACGMFIKKDLIDSQDVPSAEKLDALADAIMSIEYYLEAFVQSRVHPASVLEVAERGVEVLGYSVDALPESDALVVRQTDDDDEESVESAPGASEAAASRGAGALGSPAGTGIETAAISRAEIALPPVASKPAPAPAPAKSKPAVSEVDDEIIEIFIEEAEEELGNIARLLPQWSSDIANDEALRDLRRSFHTLKGSGRLVGASALGEFAWAFENMLNRVLDSTVRPGPAMFDMLDQARGSLAELLENFKNDAPLGDDIEMLRLSAQEMAQPGGMKLAPTAANTVKAAPQPVSSPSPSAPTAATIVNQLDMDPVLLEIYAKESEGHLGELQSFIDNYAKGAHRATEPLIRALHTLTGSSRMAGVMPVAQITTLLEKYAKTIQLERMPMSQDGIALLEDTSTFIQQALQHMQDSASNPLPSNSELVSRAEALYATVQHAEESVAARPEEGLASVAEVEFPSATDTLFVESAALEPAHGEVGEEIELGSLEPWAGEAENEDLLTEFAASSSDLERALEILDDTVSAPAAAEAAELDVQAEAAPPAARKTAPRAVIEDYDPELLDIFLEEGRDILNESEETLHAWVNNPSDRSLVEALQRQLHTLKGGARMAGITAIGDLGHSLESTIDAVVEGRLERSKRMMDLLQLSHDRLVEMLEQVSNHQPLSSGDDLIDQIYALGKEPETVREETPAELSLIEEPLSAPAAVLEQPIKPSRLQSVEIPAGIDPLELLLATGRERIEKIVERAIVWRRAPDDLALMNEIRSEAELLMNEAGSAVIVEITELAKAVADLLRAVNDGHVPTAEKMFNLLDAAGERLKLIFSQLCQRTALSNGLYLVGNINELIKNSIVEQRASVGVAVDEEIAPVPVRNIEAESEAEADDKRRHGARVQHELVRVRADLLDNMVNFAGEVSIYRSRVEQQLGAIRFNIDDLDQTVTRLREQVRQFDIETEAQIDSRYREAVGQEYEDFDPLEFDRFTHMQQLSRSMMESLNDLMSIEEMMLNLSRESETLLLQQSRVNTELQETLMHTRMVPLVEHAPRLRRIVRQTCAELKKEATLVFKGADVEMDRNVVDRILAPLEHMLRNSIAHGIELPEKRAAVNKSAEGTITVALSREGSEIVIRVTDDGAGINLDAVRKKAIDKGLMAENAKLNDKEVMHFILESGFSTAESLSQIAGRGVGMDVVASEIKQLGGILDIDSKSGKGTFFTIRLPLTLSVSRALLVYAGEDIYAIPLLSITGIERIGKQELEQLLATESPQYRWVGQDYELMHLTRVLGITTQAPPQEGDKISLLLAQSGDNRIALAVDGLVGNREIVVKSLGAQLSTLQDISGATILADGHVALIIDLPALIRHGLAKRSSGVMLTSETVVSEQVPTIMVVDDSITVRKVTERLLTRHNMKCVTAKDGVDALTVLEDVAPDLMLLDIEMPRMDGYELATHLRSSERFRDLPIIMITSRTGDKHRQRAMDIGVNVYMGKPYTEVDLLSNIEMLLKHKAGLMN